MLWRQRRWQRWRSRQALVVIKRNHQSARVGAGRWQKLVGGHPEVIEVFRDLDPPLWRELNHNPVEFLARLPDQVLQEKAVDLALDARITYAFHGLYDFLKDQDTWGARYAGPLRANPVVYFSAEFGLRVSQGSTLAKKLDEAERIVQSAMKDERRP